jgi:hypothetical protein
MKNILSSIKYVKVFKIAAEAIQYYFQIVTFYRLQSRSGQVVYNNFFFFLIIVISMKSIAPLLKRKT